MAAKNKKSHLDEVQEDTKMNMTPMIDVVFLLIIFFLCIDFRILEAKLPAYLPKDFGGSPHPEEPQEQLRIKIVLDEWGTRVDRPFQPASKKNKAYWLSGHKVHYTVGPKHIDDLAQLKDELCRIKPDKWVTDPKTHQRELVAVVVEPGTGAVYADVAPCVDVILSAGYEDIHFGGGRGSQRTGRWGQQLRPGRPEKGR
ncbi:MAG: ExbD/TolR family protein [Planctomycetota bacterium]|jgi:biopolymer transport protein ExbD